MDLVPGYINSVLHSFIWALSCVELGTLIARRYPGLTRLESLLVGFLAGCVAWVGIALLLFAFKLFNPVVIRLITYITAAGAFLLLKKDWRRLFVTDEMYKGGRLVLTILVLSQLLFAILPVDAFDALYYHLPLAQRMLETGTISWTPWIINSSFPQNMEIHQAIGLALGGDFSSSLVSWWFGIFTSLTLVALGYRLQYPWVGYAAAIALNLSPLWFWLTHVPYLETGLAFGICIMVLCIAAGFPGWVLGLAAGWLAGSKYWGLEVAGIGFVVWCFTPLKTSRQILQALAIASVVAGFWYLRNIYLFNNPLFPFYDDIFGRIGQPRIESAIQCAYNFHDVHRSPSGLYDWLILPFKLIANPSPEYSDDSYLTWKYTGWITLAFPFALIPVLKQKKAVTGIFIFTAVAILSWLVIHQVILLRFLTPLLPLIFLLSFIAIAGIMSKIRIRPGILKLLKIIALVLILVHLAGPTTVRNLLQIPLSDEERVMFLEDNVDGWRIIDALNRVDPLPTVYFLYGEGIRHYCDFKLYAGWYDPYDFDEFHNHASSGAELAQWLEELEIDILLVNERKVRQFDDDIMAILNEADFKDKYTPGFLSYKPYPESFREVSIYVNEETFDIGRLGQLVEREE